MSCGDPTKTKGAADFSHRFHGKPFFRNGIKNSSRREKREIESPFFRAVKIAGGSDKRSGNHAGSPEGIAVTSGDSADFVKSFPRNNLFMGGDLHHRMG